MSAFMIFNDTDGITATLKVFRSAKAAEKEIPKLRDKYRAQGYYRDNNWNKLDPDEVEYRVVELNKK